jgi:hypothetical protein
VRHSSHYENVVITDGWILGACTRKPCDLTFGSLRSEGQSEPFPHRFQKDSFDTIPSEGPPGPHSTGSPLLGPSNERWFRVAMSVMGFCNS